MANTPYIDLVKPAGTDKALISVLNANSDKIDSAVGGVQDALAIVCNGNTHGAITSGQYVYVRAHDTLQEGLYTANSNIAANATLSSSNLTANSSGGLNALNEQIANNSIVKIIDVSIAVSGDTSWHETTGWQSIATDYKRFFVKARVHGALANSAIIEKTVLQLLDSSNEFSLSAFWNDNNLGEIKLVGNNGIKYYANAKTKDFAFDIIVYGIN